MSDRFTRPEVKPCPLCGEEAGFLKEGTWPPGYRVFCTECGTMTRWEVGEKTVAAIWNARTELAEQARLNGMGSEREAELLDPEMPASALRLHMGEMRAQEMRTARAAIAWANSRITKAEAYRRGVEDAAKVAEGTTSDHWSDILHDGKVVGRSMQSGGYLIERSALPAAIRSLTAPDKEGA